MTAFRSFILTVGFVLAAGVPFAAVVAAPIQPFDAVVQVEAGEEALVRSGPGVEHHYPTMKLSSGDKVHVLRKDPGGWYMIDPPAGSFSWINAKNVQRNGNQGTITKTGVVVRVGAFNSTRRDIEQVRLNTGDRIEIIGEETLESDKGPELWFKIMPPRGEHRWIKGSHLVELNADGTPKVLPKKGRPAPTVKPEEPESLAVAVPADPQPNSKSGPAIQRDSDNESNAPLFGHAPGNRQTNQDPFSDEEPGTNQSEEEAIREDIALLDVELKQIVSKPPKDWDLSHQLEDLQALKEMAGDSPLAADIDRRLAKVQKYEQLHQDALVLERYRQPSRNYSMPNVLPSAPLAGSNSPTPTPGRPRSRFEGAGIVHRLPSVAPGMPQYVIAAPDRRILCYLESEPGIDLNRYLGQSMGLNGPRNYDPRLRADRMRVQKVTPIRLAQ